MLGYKYGVLLSLALAPEVIGPFPTEERARAYGHAVADTHTNTQFALMRRIEPAGPWTDYQGRTPMEATAVRWGSQLVDRT